MKRYLIVTALLFIIFACGQNSQTSKPNTSTKHTESPIANDSLFSIISEKPHVDPKYGYNKCNLEVELKHKVTIDQLVALARQLRKTRSSYDKLWIGYYLTETKGKGTAWAISNFTPQLEAEIMGVTEKEQMLMNNFTVDGAIIGKWDSDLLNAQLILYEKNKKIYLKNVIQSGGSYDMDILKSKYKGKNRYDEKGSKHKEFFLIEDNGNLGMYGENGKFSEAKKNPNKPNLQQTQGNKVNEKEIKIYKEAAIENIQQQFTVDEKEFSRGAFIISKTFVEQNLKAPKSADFPFSDYTYTILKDNTIEVRSYVDAQNALGVQLRNKYVILLKLIGADVSDPANWRMLKLKFD